MIKVILQEGYESNVLIKKIKAKIGMLGIHEWSCDDEGDFTLLHPYWNEEAWIRAKVVEGYTVKFGIISRKDRNMTTELYAVFHSSFAKMLLECFDSEIETIEISSMPALGIDLL